MTPEYYKKVIDSLESQGATPDEIQGILNQIAQQSNGQISQVGQRFDVAGRSGAIISDAQQQSQQLGQTLTPMGTAKRYASEVGQVLTPGTIGVGEAIFQGIDQGGTAQELAAAYDQITSNNIDLYKEIMKTEAAGNDSTRLKQVYNENQQQLERLSQEIDKYSQVQKPGEFLGNLGSMALDLFTAGTYGKSAAGLKAGVLGRATPSAVKQIANPLGKGMTALERFKAGAQTVGVGASIGYGYDVAEQAAGRLGEEAQASPFTPGIGTGFGVALGSLPILGIMGGKIRMMSSKTAREVANIEKRRLGLKELEIGNAKVARSFEAARRSGIDPIEVLSTTDLLNGAVTKEGRIDTSEALAKLQSMIDPVEGLVRKVIKMEEAKVSYNNLRAKMIQSLEKTQLQGADRTALINRMKAELKGFRAVADEAGDIDLLRIQTAKTARQKASNYADPEATLVRKEMARIFKEVVEENVTDMDVKTFNQELAKAYAIRSVLGQKGIKNAVVKGGRLGKYFSSTIGGLIGAKVGGGLGAIAGAEVGSQVRALQLINSLGGKIPADMRNNPKMVEALGIYAEKFGVKAGFVEPPKQTRFGKVGEYTREMYQRALREGERGSIQNPFAKLPDNTPRIDKTIAAFNASTGQKEVASSFGSQFVIGSFGKNAFKRKAGQMDRFPLEDVPKAIKEAFAVLPASMSQKSYRYNNKAFLSKDGDNFRVVYTRTNKAGQEEIINWHEIPADKIKTWLDDIGIPSQTRTGIKSLEGSEFVRLTYGDELSIPQQIAKLNERELTTGANLQSPGVRQGESSTQISPAAAAMQAKIDRIKANENIVISPQKKFFSEASEIGTLGDLSPELRQEVLQLTKTGQLTPDIEGRIRAELIKRMEGKMGAMTASPTYQKIREGITQIGLAPVKGKKKTEWDTLVKKADVAFAEGDYAAADKAYADIVQSAQTVVKNRFDGVGIEVVFNNRPGFGVYKGTPEPNLDFYAKVKPGQEEQFNRIIQDIAEKDFFQDSVVSYKAKNVTAAEMKTQSFGIIDPEKGISNEPGLSIGLQKELSLDEVKVVNAALEKAGLEAMSIKMDGKQIDIFNISTYNADYEKFIERLTAFKQELDNAGILGQAQLRVQEVRFVGSKTSGATATYGDSRRAFAAAYPGFLAKKRFYSSFLDRIKYRESIGRQELIQRAKASDVNTAEREAFLLGLSKSKQATFTPKEVEALIYDNVIKMEPIGVGQYADYRFGSIYPGLKYDTIRSIEGGVAGSPGDNIGRAFVFKVKGQDYYTNNHFSVDGYFAHGRGIVRNEDGIRTFYAHEGQSDLVQHPDRVQDVVNELTGKGDDPTFLRREISELEAKIREKQIEVDELTAGTSFTHKGIDQLNSVKDALVETAQDKGFRYDYDPRHSLTEQDGTILVTKLSRDSDSATLNIQMTTQQYSDEVGGLEKGQEFTVSIPDPYPQEATSLLSVNGSTDQRISFQEMNSVIDDADSRIARYVRGFRNDIEDWTSNLENYRERLARTEQALQRNLNSVISAQLKGYKTNNAKARSRVWEEFFDNIDAIEKPDYVAVPMPSTAAVIEGFVEYPGPLEANPYVGDLPLEVKVGDNIKIKVGDKTKTVDVREVTDNQVVVSKAPKKYTVAEDLYPEINTKEQAYTWFSENITGAYQAFLKKHPDGREKFPIVKKVFNEDGTFKKTAKLDNNEWDSLFNGPLYYEVQDSYDRVGYYGDRMQYWAYDRIGFEGKKTFKQLFDGADGIFTWNSLTDDVRVIEAQKKYGYPVRYSWKESFAMEGENAKIFFKEGDGIGKQNLNHPKMYVNPSLRTYEIDLKEQSAMYNELSRNHKQVLENYFDLVERIIPDIESKTGLNFKPYTDDFQYLWLRAKWPKRYKKPPKTAF